MTTTEKDIPSSSYGKYVYVDQATSSVSRATGLHIPEKHIEKIAKRLNLTLFKIGSRIAYKTIDFENKFSDFVAISSRELEDQKINRTQSATEFHVKIDAIFSYIYYIQQNSKPFNYTSCINFLRFYDEDMFAKGFFKESDLEEFILSRKNRGNSKLKSEMAIFRTMHSKSNK